MAETLSRVVLAGGGTGGHIFPLRALAESRTGAGKGEGLHFVVGNREGEEDWIRGFTHTALPMAGGSLPRRLWQLGRGGWRSLRLLDDLNPGLVVATGGYVALAVCGAARWRGLPFVLVEPNRVAGRANAWLARWARRIYTQYPEVAGIPPAKACCTGMPLHREALPPEISLAEGERDPVLLVLGGSLGASGLNRLVTRALCLLVPLPENFRVRHQAGPADVSRVEDVYRELRIPAKVEAFVTDVGDAYRQARLVVARGGGMTLAELRAWGKATICVPYPFHRDRQQERNVGYLVERRAACLVRQEEGPARLAGLIRGLWQDRERREEMARRMRDTFPGDGGPAVWRDLEGLGLLDGSVRQGAAA